MLPSVNDFAVALAPRRLDARQKTAGMTIAAALIHFHRLRTAARPWAFPRGEDAWEREKTLSRQLGRGPQPALSCYRCSHLLHVAGAGCLYQSVRTGNNEGHRRHLETALDMNSHPDPHAASEPRSPAVDARARVETSVKPLRKRFLAGGIAAVILFGLGTGVVYWLDWRHYESTDDAFVDAHISRVAPRVPGRVRRVLIDDNQWV